MPIITGALLEPKLAPPAGEILRNTKCVREIVWPLTANVMTVIAITIFI
jgi:hypothetical protein